MTPSVRSRLWASGVSFGFGFAVANYGLLMIAKPDQWLWLSAAAVFMVTGAVGVLFADALSSFSVWAVLGFELLAAFTLVPFAWMTSLALSPAGISLHTVWPRNATTGNFSAVVRSEVIQKAALNSLIIAGASTVIAVFFAVFAAYAIVRKTFRAKRLVYALILSALFAPLVTLVGPMASQALAFGLYDSKVTLIVCYLALTLPLSLWLFVSLFSQVPWSLRDAARADGAGRFQMLRRVYLPLLGPGLMTVTLIVFFVACNDLVLGLALGSTDSTLPIPATLTTLGAGFTNPTAATAAAGLLWFLPVLLFVLVFQRKIVRLLGRPNR
ncbi:MAG: carbohydrate ABC transporter permease [Aeromicrobium sp.]